MAHTPVADMVREHNGDYLVAVEDLEESHSVLLAALQAVYSDIELQNVEGGSAELNLIVQAALVKAKER